MAAISWFTPGKCSASLPTCHTKPSRWKTRWTWMCLRHRALTGWARPTSTCAADSPRRLDSGKMTAGAKVQADMKSGHALRCIACGTEFERAGAEFRCPRCGDLLEVVYPAWAASEAQTLVWASRLKQTWWERKLSRHGEDASGVWRFRELLPHLPDRGGIITLREGNTPVFELPRCARSAAVDLLLAKHQGMNPTGSFKDTGMTVAISMA